MSRAWPVVGFDQILERVERKFVIDDAEVYKCIGVRWYGQGAFIRTQLSGAEIARKDQWKLEPGDIVYNKLFAWKAAFALADETVKGCITSDKFPTYRASIDRVDLRWLKWYFRTFDIARQAQAFSKGAAAISKLTLNPPDFWKLTIPLPPLVEQQRVIARIEELAAKIREAQDLRAQSNAGTRHFMESIIEDVISGMVEVRKFAEVVTFRPRSGPSFLTHPDWKGTAVLMPSAVTGFGVDTTKVEYGMGNEPISEKDRLSAGDILIARGNKPEQVGNAGVVPPEAEGWVCANLLMRLQVDTAEVDPHFCIYWLRSPRMRDHVKQRMAGTSPSIQKINQRVILDYPFPTGIPLGEQRRLVAYLDTLQKKLDALRQLQAETAAELDALLPSILDRAFKGEL
ncbi:MAG: hypothetical protein ABSD47_17345 [Candidatus Methylomirabilota bacterium]|jgi:type I restriction enzyme S subunit